MQGLLSGVVLVAVFTAAAAAAVLAAGWLYRAARGRGQAGAA